jgi:hypothetical protein
MSYETLPDPRPLSVKLTLASMPRLAAKVMFGGLILLTIAGVVGLLVDMMINDLTYGPVWALVALVAGLLAFQYASAIRWMDFHKAWHRRRHHGHHHGRHRRVSL